MITQFTFSFKMIAFCFLTSIPCLVWSMEEKVKPEKKELSSDSKKIKQRYIFEDLQDWVKKAGSVWVKCPKKFCHEIQIQVCFTKVKHVKRWIEAIEGIPRPVQALYVKSKGTFCTLYFSQLVELSDGTYIKEVMNKYDTDLFELYLTSKPQTDGEDK